VNSGSELVLKCAYDSDVWCASVLGSNHGLNSLNHGFQFSQRGAREVHRELGEVDGNEIEQIRAEEDGVSSNIDLRPACFNDGEGSLLGDGGGR